MNDNRTTFAWYVVTGALIISALVIGVILWSTVAQALARLSVLAAG